MGFKKKNAVKKDGRKQKGQKQAEQQQRVKQYKKKQQVKKSGSKPKKYWIINFSSILCLRYLIKAFFLNMDMFSFFTAKQANEALPDVIKKFEYALAKKTILQK